MNTIFWQRDNTYTKNDIYITTEEIKKTEFKLSDFDTGNFIFGIDYGDMGDFDILNNPYVEFVGVQFNQAKGIIGFPEIVRCS